MSQREVMFLGTASQAPTRYRNHNGLAVRWDEVTVLFDPGENAQRQALLCGLSIRRLSAVCITHFHGDHCLGLPGIIQRRSLEWRDAGRQADPFPIYYPEEGDPYLQRLRTASIFHDVSNTQPSPILAPTSGVGDAAADPIELADLGPTASLSCRALDHRVPTYGYRIDEPPQRHFNPEALTDKGIQGPSVGELVRHGSIMTPDGTVGVDEVSFVRPGQSLAVVMDTRLCDAAFALADGVDMLVCESTYGDEHAALAAEYGHLTATQAATIARDANARRLVLTHFSARYPDPEVLADEARLIFDDVIAAQDLAKVAVPTR